MPCPSCGSHDLWDDNLAWGCNKCSWFTTGAVHNQISPHDRFNDEIRDIATKESSLPSYICSGCKYHEYDCVCEEEEDDRYCY